MDSFSNESIEKITDTSSSATERMLEEELVNLLNSQKIAYSSIHVFRDDNLGTVLGIKWDEKNNFMLAYTRLIQRLKHQEVKSLLKHEICHFLSIGTTKIHTIRAAEEYVKYLMIFREFLAHKEFIRRFGIDKWLTNFHRRKLKNYEVLVKEARSVKEVFTVEDHQHLLHLFFSILYDAVFFFVMKDNSFKVWCRKRNLSSLYRVYKWIYEDMEYFHKLKMEQQEKERLVQQAAIFPISLDLLSLFAKNRIKVMKELFDTYDREVQNIARKWLQRLTTSS